MSKTKKQYPETTPVVTYGNMLGGSTVTPYVQGQQSGTMTLYPNQQYVTYSGNIDTGSGTQGVATPPTPAQVPLYQQNAEQQRQMAYDAAAQTRQNALVQNAATYQQGLSTYGSRADSLGRMGLQGSGYADYLSGQAYVAKVNADSAARAVEAQAQQQAQATYAQNLMQGRQQAEAQLLDAINMGATPSQVKQLADSLGVSDSAYVKMATDNYNNTVQGSISAEMTDEYISSLDYDETGKADITAKRDDATLKTIFTPDTDFDTASKAIADARSKGTLSEDGEKSAWYSAYIGKIDNLHFDNPNAWTVNDIYSVEKEIEAAFKSGKLTPKDRESALAHLYGTAGRSGKMQVTKVYDEADRYGDVYVPVAEYGGEQYEGFLNSKNENSGTSRRLNYIATGSGDKNPEEGTIASIGNNYYVYYDGGWKWVKDGKIREKISNELGKTSTPTHADHQK